jgi:hypothetical protein
MVATSGHKIPPPETDSSEAKMIKTVTDYFQVEGENLPGIVDLRELEAPEPMETILMASTQLKSGDVYVAHLPHVPTPLFPHLEARGLDWQVFEETDGSALVLIRKQS